MRIAVASLSACLGCQLTLLDMGETVFQFIGENQLVYVPYLMDKKSPSECDLAIIEGGIRDERQLETALQLRGIASRVIALGSCAVYGGVPGLGNQISEAGLFRRSYDDHRFEDLPEGLGRLLPLDSYMEVDLKLPGCPPPKDALAWILLKLSGKGEGLAAPFVDEEMNVCSECRLDCATSAGEGLKSLLTEVPRPGECLLEQGYVCLGTVTRGGCRAVCPSDWGSPCTGCRGPSLQVMMEPIHDIRNDTVRRLAKAGGMTRKEVDASLLDVPQTFFRHVFAEPLQRNKRRGGTARFLKRLGETVR
jgi:F420-non-reducing hydrogenase small subunit